MKQIYFSIASVFLFTMAIQAQPCATTATTGSASNAFTNIRNATNAIVADKDLNTVVFVHRNNASAFGGTSGQLRYDLSTDGGTTWSNNQGVLNPLLSFNARYPQVTLYNPTGNTVATNAYLSYMAPTIDAGGNWNGLVSGVRRLDGTGNTETYNQPASTQTLIPNSIVKGAPGIFWTIDAVWTGTAITGFRVYKGIWNGSSDVVWSLNTTITPSFNTAYNGVAQVGDFHIAFDPTGQIGWISVLTHLTGGPTPYSLYPVFYRTTDGGTTWSAAMQVDLGQYPCITANITPGNFASTAFESDLAVDVNGEPHLLTTACNGNNAYAVFFGSWHHMVDITYRYGLWNVIDVANVNGGRGTFGVAPNTTTMDQQPMVARSADGTKVFFCWSDNTAYTLGSANTTPNLISRAYNVSTQSWTPIRDFTGCNAGINGTIVHPKLAPEVLEPSAGQYKLAALQTVFTANDPIQIANFRFLNNLTYVNADFTISIPPATVSIDQGASWILCPSTTLNLTITGSYNQVLWSTGSTALSTTVNAVGIYTVAVRAGCVLAIDTIDVDSLTSLINASSPAICPGDSTWLTVAGNGINYTWNPGNMVNDSIEVQPAATTTYTLTAEGSGACTHTYTTTITVHPQPVVAVSASSSAICIGDSATLTATGAATYNWQPINLNGNSINVSPASSTNYAVTGTDLNGCIDTDSIQLTVNTLPVVIASSDTSTICMGDTAMVMANGAASYLWTPTFSLTNASAATTAAFPVISTTYVVSGTDSNGCVNSDSVMINVNPLPVIDATGNTPVCAGDTTYLNATGAVSYLWMPLNANTASTFDTPSTTQLYVVTGTDANGCANNDSVTVIVNPLPNPAIQGPVSICAGTPFVLQAFGGSTYNWMPNQSTGSVLTDSLQSNTTYTVQATDSLGCSASATHTVNVNPLPNVMLSIATAQVCLNDGALILTGTGSPSGGAYSGPGVTGSSFLPMTAGLGTQSIVYTFTDSLGCTNTATDIVTVNACVGIIENNAGILRLYPNPFNDQLIIETNQPAKTRVEIFNELGVLVYANELINNRISIETGDWAAGMYFVQMNSGDQRQTMKLIKN
jgi:hypothetical protein